MNIIYFTFLFLASNFAFQESPVRETPDAEPAAEKLVFKTDWQGERIALPPPFAPEMTSKGFEEIRFAPGMFDPKSASFFTYVFVFSISDDQNLDAESIKTEMLTYYRGLAAAVSEGKDKEIDTSQFKFELTKKKQVTNIPVFVSDNTTVHQFSAQLDWVEPFSTMKSQLLFFEIQAWADSDAKRKYLFVCTSPTQLDDDSKIWKQLRRIRSEFKVEWKE